MNSYEVTLTFMEPLLGTVPLDPLTYVENGPGANAPDEDALDEELDTLEESEDKGWTGFHKQDEKPVLYDYVVKGFFKDACGMLRRITGKNGSRSSKIRAYRKIIDGLVFIAPRKIPIDTHGQPMGTLERPLRAQTARGERIAIAKSITCPPGTTITFTVTILGAVTEALLREWFEYGLLRGLGQWRNAGWGAFSYQMESLTE